TNRLPRGLGARGYRLQKFFRRNKLLVTASCAVLFVLLSGLAGVISQWRRAEQFATLERNDRSRAQSALTQMEAVQVRRAEEYFKAGDRRNMLTYLALVL